MNTILLRMHADFSRANCPQQRSGSKWQAFRLWDEPAVVHVSIRDWQAHQLALAGACANLEDLVRLIDLHAGPLALIAAMQFLITCICRPSPAVTGSASEQSARSRFDHMESMGHAASRPNTHSAEADIRELPPANSDSPSVAPDSDCACKPSTYMCAPCAWRGLLQLEAMLASWPSSRSAVSVRTWRLGELQPLAGWRTHDRMSSVRPHLSPAAAQLLPNQLTRLSICCMPLDVESHLGGGVFLFLHVTVWDAPLNCLNMKPKPWVGRRWAGHARPRVSEMGTMQRLVSAGVIHTRGAAHNSMVSIHGAGHLELIAPGLPAGCHQDGPGACTNSIACHARPILLAYMDPA